jgi:hypothetical protein
MSFLSLGVRNGLPTTRQAICSTGNGVRCFGCSGAWRCGCAGHGSDARAGSFGRCGRLFGFAFGLLGRDVLVVFGS